MKRMIATRVRATLRKQQYDKTYSSQQHWQILVDGLLPLPVSNNFQTIVFPDQMTAAPVGLVSLRASTVAETGIRFRGAVVCNAPELPFAQRAEDSS